MASGSDDERQLWRKALEAEKAAHFALAFEYARQYTRTYPDNAAGWSLLGKLLGGFSRFTEARKALAHALRIAAPAARSALSQTIGLFYRDKRDYTRARIWLQRHVKARPGTNAWVLLGSVFERLGEHAEAKRCHRNAIESGTECADAAYVNLGVLLSAEGEYQAAIDCFTKALELNPQYREAKLAKRDAAAALRLRNAEPPEKASTADSDEERQLRLAALEAEETEHLALALEYARQYTQAYPDNATGWAFLGKLLGGFSRFAEARKALAYALRLAPPGTRSDLSRTIGSFYKDKGDYRRARTWFQRYVKARPDTDSWTYLGSVFARLGEHAEAKRCHRNAIDSATECADEAYLNLGLVLRAEGEYEAAIDCFTKAIELDPQYREAKLAKRDVAAALRLRNAEPPGKASAAKMPTDTSG